MKINRNEGKYLQKRRRDNVGEIFEWQGKILRGIYPDKSEMVSELFESGFIPELIERNLFPNSWITDYTSDDYGIIVEHQRISPIIYPQEWSFSMLKDAALAVIELAKVAKRYGYNMKDCHGFNILMENNQPKFIDLGSFHSTKNGVTGWQPYKEFLKFYYYPLFTWKDGLEYISKLSIFSANLTPHNEHYIYKYRFLKWLGDNLLDKLIKLRFLPADLACKSIDVINEKTQYKNPILRHILLIAKAFVNNAGFFMSQDLENLEKMIKIIKRKEASSQWKNYHSSNSKKRERFNKIIEYINEYCCDAKTAVDIGGNQGAFSLKVYRETNIKKIICQDLDEKAVDIGYKAFKKLSGNISFVNYNFIAPIVKTTHPMPHERFKSDIVFALALLHHLILSQGFALNDILNELNKYSNKYICMEFMPKGLWVHEHGDKINIPLWYSVNWFRDEFVKHFEILKEEQLADNYILFVGKKRNPNG